MRNIGEKVKILKDDKVVEVEIGAICLYGNEILYKILGDGLNFQGNKYFTEKDILTEVQVRELERPKVWKPKNGDKYWIINSFSSNVADSTWANDAYDIGRYELGNCYPTKDEAAFALQKQKYLTQYKRYVEERNDKIDWKRETQYKYFAYFGIYTCKIAIGNIRLGKKQGTIYATSEQTILNFIELIGEDNFKKYLLEMEE